MFILCQTATAVIDTCSKTFIIADVYFVSNRNKENETVNALPIIADVYFVSNRNRKPVHDKDGGIIADVYFVSNRNIFSYNENIKRIIADVYFVSNRNPSASQCNRIAIIADVYFVSNRNGRFVKGFSRHNYSRCLFCVKPQRDENLIDELSDYSRCLFCVKPQPFKTGGKGGGSIELDGTPVVAVGQGLFFFAQNEVFKPVPQ